MSDAVSNSAKLLHSPFWLNLWVIPVFMILNRLRGDVWFASIGLHGRSLFYVTAMVAVVASLALRSKKLGIVFAIGFLLWGIGPWGRWFILGRFPYGFHREGVEPSVYESAVWAISFHSFYVALFIRHLNVVFGLLMLGRLMKVPYLWTLAFPIAAAMVGAYEIAWDVTPQSMIVTAEFIAGIIWGVLLWWLSVYGQPEPEPVVRTEVASTEGLGQV